MIFQESVFGRILCKFVGIQSWHGVPMLIFRIHVGILILVIVRFVLAADCCCFVVVAVAAAAVAAVVPFQSFRYCSDVAVVAVPFLSVSFPIFHVVVPVPSIGWAYRLLRRGRTFA